MMYVIPQYFLRASLPDGKVQLVVPEPELAAMLRVLHHNGATSVSYELEASAGPVSITGTSRGAGG